jgi:hypothetical protein
MALEKTDISMDLVSGADTKANPQIDPSFQKMVNVTFDGDMTAKKMNGYDLLDTLPAGEKYSLIARRQNDLIAQTDKGFYKYIKEFGAFKKSSILGSCEIVSNETSGFNFAFSDNYRCFVEYSPGIFPALNTTGLLKFNFYTHDNVFLNSITSGEEPLNPRFRIKTTKVLAIGDTFYVLVVSGGTDDTGSNVEMEILRFQLDIPTASFVYVGPGVGITTAETTLKTIDFITDGSRLFLAYSNASEKKFYRWDIFLGSQLSVNMTSTPTVSIELFNKNATELWASIATATGLFLVRVNKNTLLETASSLIGGASTQFRYYIYPTSDTTAEIAKFLIAPVTGVPTHQAMGKMFLRNGNYYIPTLFYTTNTIASVLMQVISEGMYPRGISDTGQVDVQNNRWGAFVSTNYLTPEACPYQDMDYYTALTPSEKPALVSFDYDAKETNSYLEIEKTNIYSGGLLGYYDGEEFAEYGFIGNPYISDYATNTTGALPADTGYMLCFLYKYEDAQGNIFYSPRGPIYSGLDPVNGLTLPANSRINFNLQTPIITMKGKVTIEVYIKRKNRLFQLAYSRNFYGTNGNVTMGTTAVSIANYPNADAAVMPYQDGSVPVETTSNSDFISLYADRVFRITKDNPISLQYSQKKLAGQGFEFNDSFFYVDVLDKRGIAEDQLVGGIAMDGRFIIFKETSTLYIVGSGPSRANTNDDFSEPQLIASDVGCIQPRSIILMPDGVMFKSDKGIYLLDRKLQTGYIGSSVEAFNDYTIVSAILLESTNEVRFATLEGLTLVYNYLSRAWSWYEDMESISSCVHGGKYVVLKTDGQVIVETKDHNKMIDQKIIQNISTPWLRLNKIQGYQKAYYVRILGVYKSLHRLKMNVFYDYELYSSEEYIIDPLAENQYNIEIKPSNQSIEDGSAINGVYQMKIDLIRKNCQAVRLVIEDVPLDEANNTGECFALSNVTVNIGLKKGLAKIQASKSY